MTPFSSPRAVKHARKSAVSIVLLALCLSIGAAVKAPTAPAFARDLSSDLSMHYIHQYLGNLSDNHDCGPVSVAMVLDAYKLRPAGMSDARFVASIRRTMGLPNNIGTVFDDLERALSAYGLRYSLIPSSLPGEPDPEVQMMRDATDAGNLVIPLIHGAVLGRGERYGDHWPVLAGFNGDSVHIFDPDDQVNHSAGWVHGGNITMSVGLFSQAVLKAQPGPYALVIYPPGRGPGLQIGAQARITGTDGDGAFLRSSPEVGDNKITLLPEGTVISVVGPLPAPRANDHDWIGVTVNGQQGYVAADFVSPAE
jgi:hypothetical protein